MSGDVRVMPVPATLSAGWMREFPTPRFDDYGRSVAPASTGDYRRLLLSTLAEGDCLAWPEVQGVGDWK